MYIGKFSVPLVAVLALLSFILILQPALAQGNAIVEVNVTVPACSGTDGRVDVTFIHDSFNNLFDPRWLTVDWLSRSVAINPPDIPHTETFPFTVDGATQPGDVIAITARLGTSAHGDNLDSMTIFVNCSTGVEVTAPEAVDDAVTTTENTPTSFNVLSNDTDPHSVLQPASVSNVTSPANGALVNDGNGDFIYTPALDFVGSDSFDYEVCADEDACFTATVAITVLADDVVDGGDDTPAAPPACDQAEPSVATLWPPNHQFVPVNILGLGDSPSTIEITGLISNELETAPGSGNTGPDVGGLGTDTALLRAERAGNGGGRTYIIQFTANNALGSCDGSVTVNVPHDMGNAPVVDAENNAPNNENNGNRSHGNGRNNGNANGNRNGNGNNNGNGDNDGNRNGRGRS